MTFKILFMKKFTILMILLFSFLISGMAVGCSGGSDDDPVTNPTPTNIIPSNLTLTVEVVGTDGANPNGDGSGVVKVTATAIDAVNYRIRFNTGNEVDSSSGFAEFTYDEYGTNTYNIFVVAFSSTGDYISTSQDVTVFVTPITFSTLIFSDEFDTDGSPDASKWVYDIGNGDGGWGNNEVQYYTNRTDNVTIEDGMLKIIAKKENYSGYEYTSTRMKTQGKFGFTYGRVEIKAKLPSGGGTWPALWMLGTNITTVGWPACGEIDIMEHVGNNQGTVQSAMHTPSSYGGTINHGSQYLADVSTAFHVYSVEWTSEEMVFAVDDVVHYTYNPSNKNSDTWPYDADQFIIFNIAMGGSFGGNIDPAFTESTMEIDYIRVYQ